MMKRFSVLLMAMLGAVMATAPAARAQVTAYAAGQGAVNSIEVGVEVRASVRGKCGFASGGSPTGSIDQADFDQRGFTRDFPIQLNCSGAARVAVSSSNGGMVNQATADSGYGNKAPYDVAIFLVADNGTSAAASCGASSLTAGGSCTFAGSASNAVGLRLAAASTKANGSYLRVSATAYSGSAPLVAGRYADTLSITVSVSP